jgi:hypothetical protein
LLLVTVGLAVFLLGPGDAPTVTSPGAPASEQPSADESPSQSEPAPTVESSRDVTVDGRTITVEEASTVLDGDGVRAVPAASVPLGLELIDTSVVTPDGRSSDFDSPVTLDPTGSLTVRSWYRLTGCPDVIPTQWPSPAEFPDATRTYLRLDGPLHTAYALCPDARGKAKPLPGLTGVLTSSRPTRVRLSWTGGQALSVSSVGSASGVAAVVPESAPECRVSCVVRVRPASSAPLTLQPVDPCPPATTSDRLTLLVTGGGAAPSPVSVRVDNLHRAVCG